VSSDIRLFARNGLALALGGVASQIVLVFIEILIARRLGSETYGIFATTYALILFAVYVIDAGTAWWTVQEGSRDELKLPSLLGNGVVSEFLIFTGLYALLIGTLVVVSPAQPIKQFILIFSFYGIVLAVQANLAGVFASQQRMHITALFQGTAPAAILIIYWFSSARGESLSSVATAYVLGAGAVTGVWLLWTAASLKPTFSFRGIREMLSGSYLYAMTGVLGQVLYKADIVLLAALAGAREAGIYAAAFKFLDLFYKIPILAGRVFSPSLFKRSANDWPAYRKLASGYSRAQALIGAIAFLVTFLLAEELVLFAFGSEYAESVPILKVLSAAMSIKCLVVASEGLLSSLGQHKVRVVLMAIAAALNIVLNLFLIPVYGGIGAAVGTVVTGFLLVAMYAVIGLKPLKSKRVLEWFLIPVILIAVIAFAVTEISQTLWVRLILAIAVVPVLVVISRYVRYSEIVYLLNSLWVRPDKH
jgi:O-antigen/teichoic acid export membrane protein